MSCTITEEDIRELFPMDIKPPNGLFNEFSSVEDPWLHLNPEEEKVYEAEVKYLATLGPIKLAEEIIWRKLSQECAEWDYYDFEVTLFKLSLVCPLREIVLGVAYSREIIERRSVRIFTMLASVVYLNPYNALPEFIRDDDMEAIKFIMENLKNVRNPKGDKYTLEHDILACILHCGSLRVLKYFTEDVKVELGKVYGRDLIAFGKRGDLPMVKFIIEGSSKGVSLELDLREGMGYILEGAAARGKMEVIKYLREKLETKLYINDDMIMKVAEKHGQKEVIEYIIQKISEVSEGKAVEEDWEGESEGKLEEKLEGEYAGDYWDEKYED